MHIVCAGGGTLGSVTPLLAVWEELRRRGTEFSVEWWGTQQGPERQVIEYQGVPFFALPAGKLRRYLSVQNFVDLARIFAGFVVALWRFGRSRPEVVITAGSFVGVPVGWAAWCYRIPVLIHQQDVRPSLANRLLAPIARTLTVTFEPSRQHFRGAHVVVTGNPVRQSFTQPLSVEAARKRLGLQPGVPTLVVVGGGIGAQYLNDLVRRTLGELTQVAQVVHQTGSGKDTGPGKTERYQAVPFVLDSLPLLQAADVVVTRAGMAYLTELAALSKAAVVIPLPAGHQEDNATLLRQHEAAAVLQQAGLTDQGFVATVRELMNNAGARTRLGARLHQLFPPEAAARVADEVVAAVNGRV